MYESLEFLDFLEFCFLKCRKLIKISVALFGNQKTSTGEGFCEDEALARYNFLEINFVTQSYFFSGSGLNLRLSKNFLAGSGAI